MDYIKATEKMLWDYNSYKAYIENAREELQDMEHDAGENMGIAYDKDKLCKTYKFSSVTENEAERRIERKDLLHRQIELIQNKLGRINRALNALSETDRKIIEMFYFKNQRFIDIAYEVRYSERSCKYKKKYALQKISISMYGERIGNIAL